MKDSGVELLGEIPMRWEVKRLKFLADIRFSNVDKKAVEGEEPVFLCNYVDVYKNDEITNQLQFMDATASEPEIKAFRLQIGDVLITKDSESPDDIAIPAFVSESMGKLLCGYHLAMVRTSNSSPIQGKYIFYLFSSKAYRTQLESRANGITRFGLSQGVVKDCLTPMPSSEEQQAITAFLDRKTAELDELIRMKERQIELLNTKRQALISHAVTRGLDPSVKMRPSGIEWLGEIPAHWNVTRLKYATSHIVDCHHSTPAYIPVGEYPAIRTADVTPGKLQLSEAKCVSEEEYLERISRLTPRKDDILYSREGERFGIAALVPPETKLCLGQRMMIFRANRFFVPDFLMWQLNSASVYAQAEQDTIGSTSPHVNVETICNFRLTEPPFEEQFRIVEFINGECKVIDDSGRLVREQIEQLRLYRQALISAAVTGKIDVRGVSV